MQQRSVGPIAGAPVPWIAEDIVRVSTVVSRDRCRHIEVGPVVDIRVFAREEVVQVPEIIPRKRVAWRGVGGAA